MRSFSLLAKSSLTVGALLVSANADTITFSLGQSFSDWQTIFDTPTVDVSVAAQPPNATLTAFGPGFSDLPSALFADTGAGAVITLVPAPGYSVTLNSFDLGVFGSPDDQTPATAVTEYRVVDLASNTALTDQTLNLTYSANSHTTVFPNFSSSAGLELIIGPDLFNAGINNIVFSSQLVPTSAPDGSATCALLGLGVAACAWARRKV